MSRNAGSQCQRQRPSSPRRRFLARPDRSFGRVRCGWYAAIASAASSSEPNPFSRVRSHETEDLVDALFGGVRGDVDEHERPERVGSCVDRVQPGHPAERRADPRGRFADPVGDGERIVAERRHRVVVVGRPRRVAVAAQIHRDHAVPGVGERLRRPAPRVAGLTPTVREHDGRSLTRPVVGGDHDAGRGGDMDDCRASCELRASTPPRPKNATGIVRSVHDFRTTSDSVGFRVGRSRSAQVVATTGQSQTGVRFSAKAAMPLAASGPWNSSSDERAHRLERRRRGERRHAAAAAASSRRPRAGAPARIPCTVAATVASTSSLDMCDEADRSGFGRVERFPGEHRRGDLARRDPPEDRHGDDRGRDADAHFGEGERRRRRPRPRGRRRPSARSRRRARRPSRRRSSGGRCPSAVRARGPSGGSREAPRRAP